MTDHIKTIEQALQEAARHLHPAYKQHDALVALRKLQRTLELERELSTTRARENTKLLGVIAVEREVRVKAQTVLRELQAQQVATTPYADIVSDVSIDPRSKLTKQNQMNCEL